MIYAKYAEAGVWYQHEKYGKVLCCGRRGLEYYNGFVTHDGGTSVRFLKNDEVFTKSLNQSWDEEPDETLVTGTGVEPPPSWSAFVEKSIGDQVVTGLKEFLRTLESHPEQLTDTEVDSFFENEDTLEGAEQPPTESTGELPQLTSGSSPALTDIGLRVDRHGNVVFRPDLVE